MQSVTKNQLAEAAVQALCKKSFPQVGAVLVRELKGGMFNAAYLVEGEGLPGGRAVLKVGPAPGTKILTYEQDILQAEVEVYRMLESSGVPTPKVYAADLSGQEIPAPYFFMEHLPGAPWPDCSKKIPKADRPALMRALGRYNACIHAIKGERFGYLKQNERFHFSSWGAAFTGMMTDILNDGRAGGCRLPYKAIEAVLQKHRPLLDEVTQPCLVDYDMWAGNVFVQPQNGHYEITGIVDFERAFSGDPYADFTSAVMLFKRVEQEPDFIAGYEEISGRPLSITPQDQIRMDLYRLYMSVIMYVETYRYGNPTAAIMKAIYTPNMRKILKRL